MRRIRATVGIAVALSLVTSKVLAGTTLVNVQIKGEKYVSTGEAMDITRIGAAEFIGVCTSTNGAQVVALIDDAASNIAAFATVDACGNILCTNFVVTTLCDQVAVSSNGRNETGVIAAHDQLVSPGGVYTGGAFLLTVSAANPTNSADITKFKGKGTFVLCKTNDDVFTGTITLNGLFKPAKGCDH